MSNMNFQKRAFCETCIFSLSRQSKKMAHIEDQHQHSSSRIDKAQVVRILRRISQTIPIAAF